MRWRPLLFPRLTKNPERRFPNSTTYRAALYRWLDRCDLRDGHGRLVRLTRHQWRHTLGTRGGRAGVSRDGAGGSRGGRVVAGVPPARSARGHATAEPSFDMKISR